MSQSNGLRVLVLADHGEPELLLTESILTALPTTTVSVVASGALRAKQLPPGECAVIDVSIAERSGLETLRMLRAAGYTGSAVLIVAELEPQITTRASSLGAARCVLRRDVARALPAALVDITYGSNPSVAMQELRRVQRLIAVGEVAAGMQHAINNPLTALLAEAQLLEMEELPAHHREAVERIIELCRRVTTLVRRLDVAG